MTAAAFPEQGGCDGWGIALVRSVTNLVCICRDDRITFVNPAGVAMLGADSSDSLIGRPFSDFVDPAYGELMALGLGTFAEEESGVPLKLVPPGGRAIDVNLMVTPLELGGGPAFMVECRDITRYIRAAGEASEREHRLRRILDTVAEGIITIAEDGTIQSFNPAAERLFGYRALEIIGRPVGLLIPESRAGHHTEFLARYMETGQKTVLAGERELEGRRKDGSIFSLELAASELRESHGRVFTGVVRDITERKKAEEAVKHLAHHDTLTGLPNRLLLAERLARAVVRAKRNGWTSALLFVDLDKFKPINDRLGHEAGDFVLREVAERLKLCMRASDTVARIGGDEFVVLAENLDTWEAAGTIARKIIDSLIRPFDGHGRGCVLGASVGIALYPDDAGDADGLMRCADDAMYRVKGAGRNNFMFYRPEMAAGNGAAAVAGPIV